MKKETLLRRLPQVDEVLKAPPGERWLNRHPRAHVLRAVREAIGEKRKEIISGGAPDVSIEGLLPDIEQRLAGFGLKSLRRVINATGIVIHTNLGRALLPPGAAQNAARIASSHSNLEYDLMDGKRGRRLSHIKRLLTETTGAEDGTAVNNNAAAVLIALNSLSQGKEVIVSRGELVEIGGSFRLPDVMASSGALLREVGTTNKTRIADYEKALCSQTALILKVHRSNFRITGFTEEAGIGELSALGKKTGIPVMFDLGSGCLIDLGPYGIHSEPTVGEIIKEGADIVTFSGDKLLGGPQAGIIVGGAGHIEKIEMNPLARAMRMDKMSLSALEATLMEYGDPEAAKRNIPTLRMLLEGPASIKRRALRLARAIKRHSGAAKKADISVLEDFSQTGGGALPGIDLLTYAVSVRAEWISSNRLEGNLRAGSPPVVARIKDDALILDARTIGDEEVLEAAGCVGAALAKEALS